jgi:hypothetical protein
LPPELEPRVFSEPPSDEPIRHLVDDIVTGMTGFGRVVLSRKIVFGSPRSAV